MNIEELLLKKYITDGSYSESVDGSGSHASVSELNVNKIFNFLRKEIDFIDWKSSKTLDIGSGLGYFTAYLNSQDIFCIGIEGSADLYQSNIAKDKTLIWDISKEITFEIEEKYDISFSFEVVEHVPINYQKIFWENIAKLSKYHFCSINVEAYIPTHRCMMNKEQWTDFFENEMKFKIIKTIPRDVWYNEVSPWECSEYFLLELN